MTRHLLITSCLLAICLLQFGVCSPCLAQASRKFNAESVLDHHPHDGHAHYDSHPHPTILDESRFITNRESRIQLPLPQEKDSFTFVVFGDRTGGPPEGIEILKEAVADTNLLEPDLVMTVGDLVQGYNDKASWLPQMNEYKEVMNKLLCPWFPVAGNHDIYWRGPGRPKRQHENDYEMNFGPLWYAFRHKGSLFIVLFSDEGNPETGEKSFEDPENQRMSPEQFSWLQETLKQNQDAENVFLFLHHPRWLGGNYGDDWEKVHQVLAEAGNVRAVFAGHIHQMRYDGPRDGIEYVTLATVGGGQSGLSDSAGFLHHFHVITVRKQQIAMACLPVGDVMDVRKITGTVNQEISAIARTPPTFPGRPLVAEDGSVAQPVAVELFNPASQSVEFEVFLDPADRNWIARPDHFHSKVYPGQRATFPLRLRSLGSITEQQYVPPKLMVRADYLTDGARFTVKERQYTIPVSFQVTPPAQPDQDMAVSVGEGKYLSIDDAELKIPDGPITLECWCKPNGFSQRVGLITKTEDSEFGIFASSGVPYFTINLDGRYRQPQDLDTKLAISEWQHVAGVYDGQEVRTYLDGKLVAKQAASGSRKRNQLPLIIGGDVSEIGKADSPFDGLIDAVRLSTTARYQDDFEPERRWSTDDKTALLLNFDGFVGPLAYDESGHSAHARRHGNVELVPVE
ncbi:LamG-like jellyroll fold domain-containing protein [Bythopirellula goksoeyrii]|uniref:Cyclic 3',5'-adenosine monophosphate phosphodiesterase n=1 Tax=Bythopirellula goksoeyrii TaxID=1400387 RepID=A0A5B9Q2R6_9BACT|nr:LamG-like jellyroll fold domain-containing protein [Bythopirellula goksoeyrii]QEG33274.1 cyclic 3',5'-adenosine monophosphate phosphodiesterase [Bythopirellula goksoeyrii]